MKNQIIHEASYQEEYTAKESSIKKALKDNNSENKYDFEDVDEDQNNSNDLI
jgi:hypothetical protein